MGISGLLPFVEKASRQCHISEFRGCTVAVDSYCWLHRGAFGCAEKIVRGEDTNGYVLYCLKYINLLKSYGIHVIMVFDGQFLPAKKATEEKRRLQRQKAKKQMTDLIHVGNIEEARKYMKASVNITHEMALKLVKECRKLNVDCIIAPYEADAQLAYFNTRQIADFVISEDSDLLLFGCNKIIFKMDLNGLGTLVDADKLYMCMNLRPDLYTFDKFRYMCILSGCDYLDSLPGIGIKKALKFVSLTADTNIYNVLSKLPSYLRMKNLTMTDEYKNAFMVADATFKHQLVYDTFLRKVVPLTDPNFLGTKEEYCVNAGQYLNNDIAFQLALGNLNPFTLEKLDNWLPYPKALLKSSIWNMDYQKPTRKKVEIKTLLSTKSNAPPSVSSLETENENILYDLKIEKELEIYNVASTKRKQKEESQTEEITSPVIKRNSIFAKRRKLSKFGVTEIENIENPVSSRFFKNPQNVQSTAVDEVYKDQLDAAEGKQDLLYFECDSKVQDTTYEESLRNKFQYESKTKVSRVLSITESIHTENASNVPGCSDQVVDLTEDEADIPFSSSQKENVTKSDNQIERSLLKTKLVPSKRPRNEKKRVAPKNQPTLLSMFCKK